MKIILKFIVKNHCTFCFETDIGGAYFRDLLLNKFSTLTEIIMDMKMLCPIKIKHKRPVNKIHKS